MHNQLLRPSGLMRSPPLAQQEEADIQASKDVAFAPRPPSLTTPSSFSRVEASLTAILDKLQHMCVDFSSRLDTLSNEVCQINTKVGRIARWQSRLGGFAPSPSPGPYDESFDGGDDESDDASGFAHDNERIDSQ